MMLLELKGLTKRFGGLVAVDNLNLSIKKGEIFGMIGPNGAGKTTVFNMIMGSILPTNGKVIFKGKDITGQKPHFIVKQGLSRSFQQTILFGEMTVLENILIGLYSISRHDLFKYFLNKDAIKKEKERFVEKAHEISNFMGLSPMNYQIAKNLPYGYQRMLGVAICLATNPEMILLDEPVVGMNAEEKDLMMDKIKEIRNKGITVFLIEHDMRVIMNICDRLCVLNFGSKIAEGFPYEIQKDKNVIDAYLGSGYASLC